MGPAPFRRIVCLAGSAFIAVPRARAVQGNRSEGSTPRRRGVAAGDGRPSLQLGCAHTQQIDRLAGPSEGIGDRGAARDLDRGVGLAAYLGDQYFAGRRGSAVAPPGRSSTTPSSPPARRMAMLGSFVAMTLCSFPGVDSLYADHLYTEYHPEPG